MKVSEALLLFPFVKDLMTNHKDKSLEVNLSELDDNFLSQSLLEEQSEAMGHPNMNIDLYLVKDDKLDSVSIERTTTKIYPPEYLYRPYADFPDDVFGKSESMREALSRKDMSKAQYVVLHAHGRDYPKDVNSISIALVKKVCI